MDGKKDNSFTVEPDMDDIEISAGHSNDIKYLTDLCHNESNGRVNPKKWSHGVTFEQRNRLRDFLQKLATLRVEEAENWLKKDGGEEEIEWVNELSTVLDATFQQLSDECTRKIPMVVIFVLPSKGKRNQKLDYLYPYPISMSKKPLVDDHGKARIHMRLLMSALYFKTVQAFGARYASHDTGLSRHYKYDLDFWGQARVDKLKCRVIQAMDNCRYSRAVYRDLEKFDQAELTVIFARALPNKILMDKLVKKADVTCMKMRSNKRKSGTRHRLVQSKLTNNLNRRQWTLLKNGDGTSSRTSTKKTSNVESTSKENALKASASSEV